MNRRNARWLAWTILVLTLVTMLLNAFLSSIVGPSHGAENGQAPVFDLLLLALLGFACVGALVASRHPSNPIGWLFSATAAIFALGSLADAYAQRALFVAPGSLPGGLLAAWFSWVTQGPILFGVFIFLFLLFPDGHPLSPRWRVATWLAVIVIIVELFFFSFTPGPLSNSQYASYENPFGISALAGVASQLGDIGFVLTLVLVVVSAASLVIRFRRSAGEQREQIKWLASAGAFIAVAFLAAPIIWSTPALSSTILWPILFVAAVVSLPISVGVAILKYRLYDIDLIIRRTLVYSVLTLLLALVYLGSVLVLQEFIRAITGQGSDLAIVVSTLGIAALFNPLRSRVQQVIDRRFYRRKYDAQQVLAAFGTAARDEVELDELKGKLLGVVSETMQPATLSVWLKPTAESGRGQGLEE
jgi:hypothetical protein